MKTRHSVKVNKFRDAKYLNFTTEVEIDESVEVDITVKLEDIMDDLLDALDGQVGNSDPMDLRGNQLREYLCDICGLSYRSSIEQITLGIQSLLNFC